MKRSHASASGDPSAISEGAAVQVYRRFIETHGHDARALDGLGAAAYLKGRLDIAVDLFGRAAALADAPAEIHYNHAVALQAQGRTEAAASAYRRAIALDPDYAEAHNNLGDLLKASGRQEEAAAALTRALFLKADYAEAHFNMGDLLFRMGMEGQAADHLRDCLRIDPQDSLGAGLLLARLGVTEAPARAPQAHLEKLYRHRANDWDQDPTYRGHVIVAAALRRMVHRSATNILDAGCGTGLTGALLAGRGRLEGVDLSSAMLARAREKGVYADLQEGDLVDFLARHPNRYDAIVSAATLIHFGDLAPVFAAAHKALKKRGVFIFTLFPNAGREDFAVAAAAGLARGGCYAHQADYVRRLAGETGFAVEILEAETHEKDTAGVDVVGLVVGLRRVSAQNYGDRKNTKWR